MRRLGPVLALALGLPGPLAADVQPSSKGLTHSVDEAVYLADRVVILTPRPGRVRRLLDVKLERPRDETSAEFAEYKRLVLDEIRDDMRRVARSA